MTIDYVIIPWSKLKEATQENYSHYPIARDHAAMLAAQTGENVFIFFCKVVVAPPLARDAQQRNEAVDAGADDHTKELSTED